MKFTESMIAWNVDGLCEVGIWPDKNGWSSKFSRTCGASFMDIHFIEPEEQNKFIFIDFHTLVVRDGVNPKQAHEQFLKIDEYRKLISPDIDGAEID